MKTRIICLMLVLVMCLACFAGCFGNGGENPGGGETPGGGENPGTGGTKPGIGSGEADWSDWWSAITYEQTNLKFKMTHCSQDQELSSGCERFLAGTSIDSQDIDKLVDERNTAAYKNTNVTVTYDYFTDNSTLFGFAKCYDAIYQEWYQGSSEAPDMYCNFMSDLLVASLKGCFANLYSVQNGANYFELSNPGYMADLMSSLTLSADKIYVVASDYFIDLIRAFFVVPVNVTLFNSIAETTVSDVNNDGVKDINDLFATVDNGDWTYDELMRLCAAVSQSSSATLDFANDIIGFGLGQNGLPAAGLVYTSSVTIIERDLETRTYTYPQNNEDLYKLTDKIGELIDSKGVVYVTKADAEKVGQNTPLLGIREKFVNNEMLFGGIILVGSIEYPEYQSMKNDGGFGLVPVPVYKDGDKYLTQIHVVGRAGAISSKSTKFSQCSAFLQYQSSYSTDILNEYYNYNLTQAATSASDTSLDGNVDMLKYIRSNVRTSFDKLFEDAIGFLYLSVDSDSAANRYHTIIQANGYKVDMRNQYSALVGNKQDCLRDLVALYNQLPA